MALASGNSPGIGLGMYNTHQVAINQDDFTNPNEDQNRQRLLDSMAQRNTVGAPVQAAPQGYQAASSAGTALGPAATAGPAALSAGTDISRQDEQFRNGQAQLADQLFAAANGKAPSLGTQMIQSGTDRALAQQVAAARASRGNPALAARTAANTSNQMVQDANTQAAQVRIQEQQAAQNQLGNVLSGARGQDIGVNTSQADLSQNNNQFNAGQTNSQNQFDVNQQNQMSQAGAQLAQNNQQFNATQVQSARSQLASLQQQAAAGNQQAATAAQQLQDQMNQYYQTAIATGDQQAVQNMKDYWGLNVQQNTDLEQIQENAYNNASQRDANFVSGLMSSAGSALGAVALSDKRTKKNIKPMSMKDFLKSMKEASHA